MKEVCLLVTVSTHPTTVFSAFLQTVVFLRKTTPGQFRYIQAAEMGGEEPGSIVRRYKDTIYHLGRRLAGCHRLLDYMSYKLFRELTVVFKTFP